MIYIVTVPGADPYGSALMDLAGLLDDRGFDVTLGFHRGRNGVIVYADSEGEILSELDDYFLRDLVRIGKVK